MRSDRSTTWRATSAEWLVGGLSDTRFLLGLLFVLTIPAVDGSVAYCSSNWTPEQFVITTFMNSPTRLP